MATGSVEAAHLDLAGVSSLNRNMRDLCDDVLTSFVARVANAMGGVDRSRNVLEQLDRPAALLISAGGLYYRVNAASGGRGATLRNFVMTPLQLGSARAPAPPSLFIL
ncbi:hypothetical protein EVAR_53598_1 [Eumeta japonica]|uniref:Uncharacterized protein n=1 Tax=Eumeta variegata TaxID=151549 RepID=A0A4C1X2I1_EUMVA|nr:hypothetical protein EVAR_53598_1 [Eumeta japonica]